jgi:RNA polymerase sigma-70 factor (ECF subfamily)
VRFSSKGVISKAPERHCAAMGDPNPDRPDTSRTREASAAVLAPAPLLSGGASTLEARIHRLVAEHMDFVWRSLRRLGVPEPDCDDGCQRVWVVLTRKVDAIEPDKTRSYIFSVVVRVASEMRRVCERHQHVELDERLLEPSGLDAEGLLEQKRVRQLLDQVLSTLSWELRTVFVMFEIEGLSSPEIADALGVSRGTVASRLRLAREAFQRGVQRCQARAQLPQPALSAGLDGQPSKWVS